MTRTYSKINFDVKGTKRKELVSLISNFTGCEAKYKGAPSFAYEVDHFTIDKNGAVTFDDRADSEVIERLLEMLYDNGFTAENSEMESTAPGTESEGIGLSINIPIDKVNVENMVALLKSKGDLIKTALGIDNVDVVPKDELVEFPWFGEVNAEDAMAYSQFISALCNFTKKQTRINAVSAKAENPKYAFRCFLLRLGFIGDEYKKTRKILLRNLEGSSAFKNGRKNEVQKNG